MNTTLRILTVLLVLMIVVGLAAILVGCDGSGGVGGQGIVINVYQNSPPGGTPGPIPVTLPSPMPLTELTENTEKDIPVTAGNYSNIRIGITDGGTALVGGNPSPALAAEPEPAPQATTQPAE